MGIVLSCWSIHYLPTHHRGSTQQVEALGLKPLVLLVTEPAHTHGQVVTELCPQGVHLLELFLSMAVYLFFLIPPLIQLGRNKKK